MNLLQPLLDLLVSPFAEFAFMRRALVATGALSLSAAPLGVFLTLRRMSLLGDLQVCQVVDPLKTMRFALPKIVVNRFGGVPV